MSRSVVLLGGPDSGKTNYIGRVWPALDAKGGCLQIAQQPDDITFVLEVTDHLNSGNFAPRTELADARRDFEVIVSETEGAPRRRSLFPTSLGSYGSTQSSITKSQRIGWTSCGVRMARCCSCALDQIRMFGRSTGSRPRR